MERPLNIDASGQMIASILSKKKAAGATHVLVDIPVGPTAKVGSYRQAYQLRKLFEFVGEHMGMTLDVIITDGSQPVGRGIGPVLEVRDVMQVLRNDPAAPKDFAEKCLDLAGRAIDFHPAVRGGYGRSLAEEILKSGRALDKMERIVQAQGPNPPKAVGERVLDAKAAKTGRLTFMDNQKIAKCAKLAGAPTDTGAGVDLLKKLGDSAVEGEPLFRIHAEGGGGSRLRMGLLAEAPGDGIHRLKREVRQGCSCESAASWRETTSAGAHGDMESTSPGVYGKMETANLRQLESEIDITSRESLT